MENEWNTRGVRVAARLFERRLEFEVQLLLTVAQLNRSRRLDQNEEPHLRQRRPNEIHAENQQGQEEQKEEYNSVGEKPRVTTEKSRPHFSIQLSSRTEAVQNLVDYRVEEVLTVYLTQSLFEEILYIRIRYSHRMMRW